MKKILSIIAVLIFIVASLFWYSHQNPVPLKKLELLQKGMTRDQVKGILGTPTKKYEHGQWTYSRFFVFGFVNIHWQDDDTYDGEYNYERY